MRDKTDKTASYRQALEAWIERDLTAAARAHELRPAWELDELLDQVGEILDAGRIPVLVGDGGVGKTALVHELARRAAAGRAPRSLQGRRIVQIGFRRRAAALK